MPSLHLRPAVPEDAGELLSIYRPYVEHTAVTFEYAVPTPAQFTQRVRDTLATHPYLVAEAEGTLLGYAYAAPFHPRAAYQWAAETTIYLRQDQRGRGLGRRLYGALEALLTLEGRAPLPPLSREDLPGGVSHALVLTARTREPLLALLRDRYPSARCTVIRAFAQGDGPLGEGDQILLRPGRVQEALQGLTL